MNGQFYYVSLLRSRYWEITTFVIGCAYLPTSCAVSKMFKSPDGPDGRLS